jgi:cell wall-associated NlpC family hydrolase
MADSSGILALARELIGVPFRLHGRDPATGLDCIGVVAFAVGGVVVPTGYRMRQGTPEAIVAGLDAALVRVAVAQAGDVLLFEAGPAQFHLGVMTGRGFVHACALLRRVVETPGIPVWSMIGAWRKRDN